MIISLKAQSPAIIAYLTDNGLDANLMLADGAKEDRITSYKDAERLASEVSGPVTLLLIEGANHVAHNRGHMFKTQAADWIAGHLGAAGVPPSTRVGLRPTST